MPPNKLPADFANFDAPEKLPADFDFGDDKETVSPDSFKQARSSLSWSGNILENIRNGESKRNLDAALGAATGLGSFGAQNAGPVGAEMTKKLAPELQSAMKPDPKTMNQDQAYGLGMERVAELGVGLPKATVGAVRGTPVLAKYLSERAAAKATKLIQATEDTMTKGEHAKAALEPGRVGKTFTGALRYNPSETEKRAGQLLSGKLSRNPIDNIPVIQKEIGTRGQAAEKYLGQNGRLVDDDEVAEMLAMSREEARKYLITENSLKSYDETVRLFSEELAKLTTKDQLSRNTGTYYKALKNFEQNVTSKLRSGHEGLLDETGAAKLEGARMVRNTIRELIGNKHPQFKEQMYDLASLYDALDNTVTKSHKLGNVFARFKDQHPFLAGGFGTATLGGLGAWAWNKVK